MYQLGRSVQKSEQSVRNVEQRVRNVEQRVQNVEHVYETWNNVYGTWNNMDRPRFQKCRFQGLCHENKKLKIKICIYQALVLTLINWITLSGLKIV